MRVIFSFSFIVMMLASISSFANDTTGNVLRVLNTNDFTITGEETSNEWNKTDWITLPQRNNSNNISYQTQFKILYSDSGIYCLYKCEDKKITATLKEDFLDLYNEDVVEAFFWTNDTIPLYFEYELSPLGYELPIIIPNAKGYFYGWRPWHYEGNRKTKHASHITKQGDNILYWTAEFYIPYTLLKPLTKVPPTKGTQWRANFYRIDYDKGTTAWSWQLTRKNFHDYEKFGTIEFE
jgi:hypothetical protein